MFQVVVQSLSHVQLFATLWITASQAPLSFTIFQSLLKLLSTESVISSNHLILRCPLLLLPVFPSIRVFSNESALEALQIAVKRREVGWFGRMALKHVYYHVRNESPVYVWCRIQDAWGWCMGMIQRDDMSGRWEGGSCLGTHLHPWQIHVNVWQNQYSIVK